MPCPGTVWMQHMWPDKESQLTYKICVSVDKHSVRGQRIHPTPWLGSLCLLGTLGRIRERCESVQGVLQQIFTYTSFQRYPWGLVAWATEWLLRRGWWGHRYGICRGGVLFPGLPGTVFTEVLTYTFHRPQTFCMFASLFSRGAVGRPCCACKLFMPFVDLLAGWSSSQFFVFCTPPRIEWVPETQRPSSFRPTLHRGF